MRLFTGTSVFRLFPGTVQIGTDPGAEVIFSGLTPAQEAWLLECARLSQQPRAFEIKTRHNRLLIPSDCRELAQRLMSSGLGYHLDDYGLSVRVHRLEEPVLLALEMTIGNGCVSQCNVRDSRSPSLSAFTYTAVPQRYEYIDVWAHDHLRALFPELPRPLFSSCELEIRSTPLSQMFCEDFDFLSLPVPRLMVGIGQTRTFIGPILSADSELCPLCVSLWISEERTGACPQTWEEEVATPVLNPTMKMAAALHIASLVEGFHHALRSSTRESFVEHWQHTVLLVDSSGHVEKRFISPHPQCQCVRALPSTIEGWTIPPHHVG